MFKKKFDFVVVGGATRDFMFYDNSGKFLFTPENLTQERSLCFEYGAKINVEKTYFTFGGGGANVAVNLAKQGFKTAILTAVGDDENGQAMVNNLQQAGVATRFVERPKDKLSGFSFILTAGQEKEHVIFYYDGAKNNLVVSPRVLRKMKSKWFYLASLSGSNWREILNNIFNQKTKLAWNPGAQQLKAGYYKLKDYLEKADVLIVNKDEATELVLSLAANRRAGEKIKQVKFLLKALKKMGPKTVLITEGSQGAGVYDGHNFYQQKAKFNFKKTVDTTGVGDCFNSTFVAGLEKFDGDIKKALSCAAKNAAAVVTKVGAQNGLIKVI
jgi:sugar/nucleoside kinase (ribokinase family)